MNNSKPIRKEKAKIPDHFATIFRGEKLFLTRVKLANTFGSRLRGLMFFGKWPDFDGLLIYPCRSIHMFWMWFPLDLIYLDRQGRIILTAAEIAPNKIGPTVKEAWAVLEVPAGTIARFHLKEDEILWWR